MGRNVTRRDAREGTAPMPEVWTIHWSETGSEDAGVSGPAVTGMDVLVVPLSRAEKAEAERDQLREVAAELAEALKPWADSLHLRSYANPHGRRPGLAAKALARWGALSTPEERTDHD